MRIQLPNETWMEILNWLRRRDLVDKLDQLWDRQFTPIVQGWLHKYTRNVKMGILAAKAGGGLHLCLDGVVKEVPIAQAEMPENIISFERITISRHPLEPQMLTFLHLMRPLFRNVCLDITDGPSENEWTNQRYQTAIRLFIQLVSDHGQIESLCLDCQWLQFLADNFRDALLNARLLDIYYNKPEHNELMINWLFTRREYGQPRTLMFYGDDDNDNLQFCTRVRERFLDPTRQLACPFFIRVWAFDDEPFPIPAITENVATGFEQLTIRQVQRDDIHRRWLISNCCPLLNVNDPEFLTKKTAEVIKWDERKQQRTICLDFPTDDISIIIDDFPFPLLQPQEGLFSRMMNALKRMISNCRMAIFG